MTSDIEQIRSKSSDICSAESELDLTCDAYLLSLMIEDDIGQVMEIEVNAFSDPWMPVAYAMEIRHNPTSNYIVAKDGNGDICGYIGWWSSDDASTIAHIAVHPKLRRQGLGKSLIECALKNSRNAGKSVMQLHVRKQNAGARAFYRALGFEEVTVYPSYYTSPIDDGVVMARDLSTYVDCKQYA